ncbi:glycosyltransferase family 4 protein [Ornithinibacillus sp. 4-3]|uniref:Glycosyltransferase family 4 protein n=1 Tax=Ornithinibacillus sp. 4-3 TaxID=3231488 RepID=A0AB39HPL3_9BACI
MIQSFDLIVALLIACVSTFILTIPVRALAMKFEVLDHPNRRKIHENPTPRLGGVAIFIGSYLGILYLQPQHEHLWEIFFGSLIIVIIGALDDRFELRPYVKLGGHIAAAALVISSGLVIEKITLPFFGVVELGFISVLVTFIWIIGITNAINLIDGLDGLATGVTTIAFTSMLIMAMIDVRVVAAYFCIVLIGSNLGFLYHNFYPAKIYMGDSGSNFLGYMIAVVSILGLFKNIALLSFIIPVILLAVPIFDTFFAIVRRIKNKESIMVADNYHVHYQLLRAGYTHRGAVVIIYVFSAVFGVLAVLFAKASITFALLITALVLVVLHLLAEMAGIVLGGRRPVIDAYKRLFVRKKNVEDR